MKAAKNTGNICQFGLLCKFRAKGTCTKLHTNTTKSSTPCRYGEECKNPESCKYTHPKSLTTTAIDKSLEETVQ